MAEWYTRTFEGRVERSVRVQVPPTTIKKGITYVIPFLIYLSGGGFNTFIAGSADIGFQDSLDAFILAMMPSCC